MCDPLTALGLTASADASAAAGASAAAATSAGLGSASITAGLSNLAASTAVAGSSDALLAGGVADLAASTIGADAGWTAADVAGSGAASGGLSGINFARMLNIGSSIFTSAGQYLQGKSGAAEKNFEATQLDQNAKEKVAAGTSEMQILGRNTDLAVSKARNNAAAGGGSLDPSVVNILGDLEKQGGQNEANALFNAQSSADNMENQATSDRFQAKQYGIGGDIGAAAGLFSGLTKSMSAKYGADTSVYGGF